VLPELAILGPRYDTAPFIAVVVAAAAGKLEPNSTDFPKNSEEVLSDPVFLGEGTDGGPSENTKPRTTGGENHVHQQ
jgi:hypothetical protein